MPVNILVVVPAKFLALILAVMYQTEIVHGCSSDNVSLFKALLQWLQYQR